MADAPAQPQPPANASPLRRNLPNALTGARIVLAAAFVVLMTLPRYGLGAPDNRPLMGVALGVFIVAAITDALDGYLARRWRVVSVFGRIMDPFADKILVLGAFVMLAGPQFSAIVSSPAFGTGEAAPSQSSIQITAIASWMVVVILARDLLITTLRGIVEGRGESFAALPAGKIKMIVQSIGIPLILLMLTIEQRPLEGALRWVILASAWSITLITAWSAIPYCLDARRKLNRSA